MYLFAAAAVHSPFPIIHSPFVLKGGAMNAEEIIRFIHDAEKKTPVKVYVKASKPIEFPNCKVFGGKDCV
ncbi:MAG: hypothetical protein ACSW8J_05960, partial [bacterium]